MSGTIKTFTGVLVVWALTTSAGAAVYQWDAVAGGDGVVQDGTGTWSVTAANWHDQTTPANDQDWADGNDAVFGGGAGGTAGTVVVSGTVSPSNLTFDLPNAANYTFSGGTIDIADGGGITVNATGTTAIGSMVTSTTLSDHVWMSVDTVNTNSTLTLSGGTGGDPMGWNYGLQHLGDGSLTLSGTARFGRSGLGNGPGISGQGSTLVIAGDVTLADLATFGLSQGNTMDITGSLSSSGAQHMQVEGAVTLSGTGRWSFKGTGINWLTDGNGNAVLNIRDDATLEVDRTAGVQTAVWSPGGLVVCAGWNSIASGLGTGTVNQDGGTVSLPVTVAPGLGFNGAVGGQGLWLGGMRSDPNGGPIVATYNLNAGTLFTSGVYNLSGLWTGTVIDDPANYNQTAIFNFNGGTLKASQDDSTDPGVIAQGNNHFMGNLTHAYVKAGGAIIDTGGYNASIDQALEHDPALGGTPDGGLQKLAAGTLTLLQTNTYTGNTLVSDGTLTLADNAQLTFVIGPASGVNNSISGAGTAVLDGDFYIDTALTEASDLVTGTWLLENVTSLTGVYGSTFQVVDSNSTPWMVSGDRWTKRIDLRRHYTFDEATGTLILGISEALIFIIR